ncbi:stage II sporulation protein P [Paenibacillus sp. TRM 82003]|nr:stage II sporulation protein P [Paenibacillus sp. TRM 82003]MCI3923476.1 stage II sporulation protein P [Paenibacillus sp. TRM 82003]
MKPNGSALTEALAGIVRALAAVIAWCVIGSFVAVTAVSIFWKLEQPPIRGLDGAAASLPSLFYADMLSMEVAGLSGGRESSSFSARNVTSFLTRLTTGIDPGDPRTLTAQLLPGGQGDIGYFVVLGVGTDPSDVPVEVPPAPHLRGDAGQPSAIPDPSDVAEPPPVEPPPAPPDEGAEPEPTDPPVDEPPPLAEEIAGPRVFVYHSHPTEAFLPYLDGVTEVNLAYDDKNKEHTVTAIGAHFGETLEKLGIGASHSDKAYPWNTAYDESRKTVKAAMQENQGLEYFIDIHRDSARKSVTALEHEGQTYAKLFFVIGQKNPNYEQNQAFANELHQRVEEKMLGLSRGVFIKNRGSHGEFNQSLSPQSVVVEVGGVDNTMEECYRTVEILAEVLAEMHWENTEAVEAGTTPTEPAP